MTVFIVKTKCEVCGRIRNQHVDHKACAKVRQQQWAAANTEREVRRVIARG